MKKMSQEDFGRLQKKKGFKVKRKMGAKNKPGPVVEDEVASSGAKLSETPAPALMPLMEKMGQILERMDAAQAPITKTSVEPSMTMPARVFPEQRMVQATIVPDAPRAWTHETHRDKRGFMKQIISTDRSGNMWTHNVLRSDDQRIEEVISKSDSGMEFSHLIKRDKRALISGATTTPL